MNCKIIKLSFNVNIREYLLLKQNTNRHGIEQEKNEKKLITEQAEALLKLLLMNMCYFWLKL